MAKSYMNSEYISTREASERFGFSQRYWQNIAKKGIIPNTKRVQLGRRCAYLLHCASCVDWWSKKLEPVDAWQENITSFNETVSGGSVRHIKASKFGSPSKQEILEKLKRAATIS